MSNPWGMATAEHASQSFCVVVDAPLRCFSKMACPGPAKAVPGNLGRRQCPAPNQIVLSYFFSPILMLWKRAEPGPPTINEGPLGAPQDLRFCPMLLSPPRARPLVLGMSDLQ